MNIKIMYHSKSGNTKKLADAIGEELAIKPTSILDNSFSFDEVVDLLFIGDGIYAGKASKHMTSFISQLDNEKIKNVTVFATYGGQPEICDRIKQQLNEKGLNVIDETFSCKGKSWWIANRKHPNDDELNQAKEFAKRVVKTIK